MNFSNRLFSMLFKPLWDFVTFLIADLFFVTLFNYFSFWKTSNYADGYWFLYSNKKLLYETLTIGK